VPEAKPEGVKGQGPVKPKPHGHQAHRGEPQALSIKTQGQQSPQGKEEVKRENPHPWRSI